MVRILAQDPLLTTTELAGRLSKSPAWLSERLGLVKLQKDIAALVDENRINLSNAYALAKLPEDEQASFLDRAMTMQPQEFVPTVNFRTKELRDAKRQGRDAKPAEWQPVPRLRKLAELRQEMESTDVGKLLLAKHGIKDPLEAFKMAVKWSLHLDPESIAVDRQKEEDRKKKAAEEKEARKKEREEKKQQEAIEKAALLDPSVEIVKSDAVVLDPEKHVPVKNEQVKAGTGS